MSRSYRLFFVAVAGLILAAAQQPKEQAQAGNTAQQEHAAPLIATPSPAPEPSYRPYPDYNPDPCYSTENHNAADLCAQWRAALAAEKAAHEARRATNWAIGATFLSFVGVSGLIYTILQTHGALGEARRGNLIAAKGAARSTRRAVASARETEAALSIANESAKAMKASAGSMEKVSAALQEQAELALESTVTSGRIAHTQERFAMLQMRAYISVTFGSAAYQDRSMNLRFTAMPNIRNSGHTAAREVAHRIAVEIAPYPPPANKTYALPPEVGKDGFIPPQEDRNFSGWVPNFVDDTLIESIRERRGWALYAWGQVSYKDEFGFGHETNFGFTYYWIRNEQGGLVPMAEYIAGMNDAT